MAFNNNTYFILRLNTYSTGNSYVAFPDQLAFNTNNNTDFSVSFSLGTGSLRLHYVS